MKDQWIHERCVCVFGAMAALFFVWGIFLPSYAHAEATSTATTTVSADMSGIVASTSLTATATTASTTLASRTNVGLEQKVRTYFADIPVMAEIARCESRFRQYGSDGKALRGGLVGKMIGLFQLYADIHSKLARALGADIFTPEGNMTYARHLFELQGTDPWLASFHCWGSAVSPENATTTVATTTIATTTLSAAATSSTMLAVSTTTTLVSTSTRAVAKKKSSPAVLTKDMSLGVIHPQVKTLQKILNENGFALASSGPGSPGKETQKFGTLARNAVRKFQCSAGIACAGSEHTTGYGFVGARTRSALQKLANGTNLTEGRIVSTVFR